MSGRDTIELVAPEQPDFNQTFEEVAEEADEVAQRLRRIAANAVAANPECRPDLENAVQWLETVASFMTCNGVVKCGAYGKKNIPGGTSDALLFDMYESQKLPSLEDDYREKHQSHMPSACGPEHFG